MELTRTRRIQKIAALDQKARYAITMLKLLSLEFIQMYNSFNQFNLCSCQVDICTVLCVYRMNVVLEQKIVDRETVQMVSIVDTILDSI